MSTSNAFPTPSEEQELIKYAWNRANEETSQEVPIDASKFHLLFLVLLVLRGAR